MFLCSYCLAFFAVSCATGSYQTSREYHPCYVSDTQRLKKRYWLYGFETSSGVSIVKPKFTSAAYYNAVGIALGCESIKQENDTCAYIDETGRYLLSGFTREEGGGFSEGLAKFKKGGKFGYIDKTLKFVIPPQFESAMAFLEGLAAVQLGGKWGYIDKTGRIVIPPQFMEAYGFSEGLAGVQLADDWARGWGFIDKTGKVVFDAQFKQVKDFRDGLAAVNVVDVYFTDKEKKHWSAIPRGWRLIDKTGKIIVKRSSKDIQTYPWSHQKMNIIKQGVECTTMR